MKNMKIKSYTFKKNQLLNKESKSNTQIENSKHNAMENSNLNSNVNSNNQSKPSNVLSDVEKILKSPGLNISLSKADDKGNRLMDIFYNSNSINNSNKNKHSNLPSPSNNNNIPSTFEENNYLTSTNRTKVNNTQASLVSNQTNTITSSSVPRTSMPNEAQVVTENKKINNKINIKLNINSEVVNNNIRLNKKSSSGISPDTSTIEENKKIDLYYKELIREKDIVIDQLKKELDNAKVMIHKLRQSSSNSFERDTVETGNTSISLKRQVKGQSNSMNLTQGQAQSYINNSNNTPSNSSTLRKGLFTLDLAKNISSNNDIKMSAELFSDRPIKNNQSQSLLKTLSSGKKDKYAASKKKIVNNASNQKATLFRQSNKVHTNTNANINNTTFRNNEILSKSINPNHNPNQNNKTTYTVTSVSPIKSKTVSNRPIEEILQSTVKLIDTKRMSEEISKIASNNKEIHQNLRNIKGRAQKVLNLYSELVLTSNKRKTHTGGTSTYNYTQSINNTHSR